jgi:hypothetical protein
MCIFVYFGELECVDTTMLMCPILYFLEMSEFEPRELLYQAGALPAWPSISFEIILAVVYLQIVKKSSTFYKMGT